MAMQFKDLAIGDTFDFISGTHYDSFYARCTKVDAKRYVDENGTLHTVGTAKCNVYHVEHGKPKESAMNDHDIVLAIQQELDGVAWTPETLETIAEILRANDYRVRDLDDKED